MRRTLAAGLLVVCVYGSVLLAAEPAPPAIRLPVAPVQPAPAPSAITKLTGDLWYVIDSDVSAIVLASPNNLLTIAPEAGPLRIRGKFVDGTGKVETRQYKGKFIWVIEAAGKGRAELLILPDGVKEEKDVLRRTLDVDNGAPKPPDPDPDPDPKPDPPGPVTGLRVLLVYETADNLTREQLNIINSTAIVDYLNKKCVKDAKGKPEWRRWDKDVDTSKETETMKKLWAATKPQLGKLPVLVVVTDQKGDVLPLPETEAATLELLKKYGGQ